jgi:uncharacterized protein YcgL (UPF0745 family)
MEAKQKALNLCQKFGWVSITWEQTNFMTLQLQNAKQCALIAVDEVINQVKNQGYDAIYYLDYWQQVKTEINLL